MIGLDALLLRGLIHEIGPRIVGSRIEKIHQPDDSSLYLKVFPPQSAYLAIGAAPRRTYLLLQKDKPPCPPTPPLFCLLLRSRLEGAFVSELVQHELDRIFVLKVQDRNRTGFHLVGELFGAAPDLYLVEAASGKILGHLRRTELPSRSRAGCYVVPPPSDGESPLDVGTPGFRRFLGTLESRSGCGLARAQLDSYLEDVRRHAYRPSVVTGSTGEREILLARWESLPDGFSTTPFDSLEELARRVLVDEGTLADLGARRLHLRRLLERMIHREEERLRHTKQNIESLNEADKYERWGNLLKVNMSLIRPYRDAVEVTDYTLPESPKVVIPLKVKLAPRQNVERLFSKAKRLQRSRPALEKRLEEHEANLSLLATLSADIEVASDREALSALELRIQGLGRATGTHEKESGGGPLEFVSSDGYRILVGRNQKENDLVSRKLARSHDVWLHAAGLTGAHVIVKMRGPDEECPERTLKEAAQLAAHYSKGRYSAKLEILYTRARHVRKVQGAPAGEVSVTHQQTLVVLTDQNVPARLSRPL